MALPPTKAPDICDQQPPLMRLRIGKNVGADTITFDFCGQTVYDKEKIIRQFVTILSLNKTKDCLQMVGILPFFIVLSSFNPRQGSIV